MKFSEVVGQNEVKEKLIRSARTGRISHAQLFFGPEGSGALPLALAYAQFVNCQDIRVKPEGENGLPADSCGECPSCVKFSKLAHPDLHFIFPVATTSQVPKSPMSKDFYEKWRGFVSGNGGYGNLFDWYDEIGIERKQGLINADDCSEILRTLSYKSYQGGFKVMIIWMVEKLFHAAAPKILKVLEEPPEKTLFLLVTEQPDQIISTIRSRTQLVKIPAITDPDLEKALKHDNAAEREKIRDVVRLAQGNFREARRLMNEENPDHLLFDRFRLWMRLCFKNKADDMLDLVRELSGEGREAQKRFLRYALRIIRESFLLDIRGESLSRLSREELDFVRNFSPYVNPGNAAGFARLLEDAIQHIERNANASITLTWLSLRFARLLKVKEG